MTSLEEYMERMKDKQEHIYFMAGTGRQEVERSPFVERLLKKGYEVLYLVEAVDEYCIQSLPEFEGKKFQNVAKEGLKMDESEAAKERFTQLEEDYKEFLDWLKDEALKDKIEKAVVSERLTTSPCALVASQYGWSGNMEKIMTAQAYQKAQDPSQKWDQHFDIFSKHLHVCTRTCTWAHLNRFLGCSYYKNQKRTLEINPRHPLIRELRVRYEDDSEDRATKDLVSVLFNTAVVRSGYQLPNSIEFANEIETMLRLSMNIDLDEKVRHHWPVAFRVLWKTVELRAFLLQIEEWEDDVAEDDDEEEEYDDEEEVADDEQQDDVEVGTNQFSRKETFLKIILYRAYWGWELLDFQSRDPLTVFVFGILMWCLTPYYELVLSNVHLRLACFDFV